VDVVRKDPGACHVRRHGTEVNIVQEGLPDVIPVEACYLGRQRLAAATRVHADRLLYC